MELNRALYVLSMFFDISNGHDTFHQRRVAMIAYKIAQKLQFEDYELNLILQAGFIHDTGLLSEASKIETFRQIINENFKQLSSHAARSSIIARFLNMNLDVSNAINLHHNPQDSNPVMLGSILFLADNIEVSYRGLSNPFAFNELYDFVAQKDYLFNKDAFKAFRELSENESFWYALDEKNLDRELLSIVNNHISNTENSEFLKRLAYVMAYRSDNISPFFENYSIFVKNIAMAIGYKLSLDINNIILSALFSHVGYVFLPTDLLNSPNKLNEIDFNIIKSHPYYTKQMLDMLGIKNNIKYPAIYHHENKEGSGYPFRIETLDKNIEVIRIATFLAALLQDRPYRVAYGYKDAKNILKGLDFHKDILGIAFDLDLEKIVNVKDDYYESIRRVFI